MEILRVDNLVKNFGGIKALQDITFTVEQGEKLAIIGPNGAGKTTLLNVINGQLPANSGQIFFRQHDITKMATYKRAHLGMARSFQVSTLFRTMSVLTNLLLAYHGVKPSRLQTFRSFDTYSDYIIKSEKLLTSVGLWRKRDELVRNLSHGEQKKLEIALSLASEPNLVLLDEPSAGLTADERIDIINIVQNLGTNITILVVAHDMDLVFGLADQIMVLHYGQIICKGTPQEVQCNSQVTEIYMGSEE